MNRRGLHLAEASKTGNKTETGTATTGLARLVEKQVARNRGFIFWVRQAFAVMLGSAAVGLQHGQRGSDEQAILSVGRCEG